MRKNIRQFGSFAWLLFAAIALLFIVSGCTTNPGKDLATFVAALPTNTVTDASLQVSTPLWSHQLSATGMSKAKDGTIQITNLKDNFAIPLWGTTKTFSVSGLTVEPGTSVQLNPPTVAVVPYIAK